MSEILSLINNSEKGRIFNMLRVLNMTYKVGFIGCGNMASAIIKGIINNAGIAPEEIIASDARTVALDNAKSSLSIITTTDNKAVASSSEVIFLSVKPQFYEAVIEEIKSSISKEQIVITIAPGKTINWLQERL